MKLGDVELMMPIFCRRLYLLFRAQFGSSKLLTTGVLFLLLTILSFSVRVDGVSIGASARPQQQTSAFPSDFLVEGDISSTSINKRFVSGSLHSEEELLRSQTAQKSQEGVPYPRSYDDTDINDVASGPAINPVKNIAYASTADQMDPTSSRRGLVDSTSATAIADAATLLLEASTLKDFKLGLEDDPKGALSSWKSEDAYACEWNGVQCDPQSKRVVAIHLGGHQLRGVISPSMGNLSVLEMIDLSNNKLTGPIPASLSNCSKLREILLHDNELTGSIPSEFWRLVELTSLHLNANQLSGTIPDSLGIGSKLKYLNVDKNQFTGSIPASLGNCFSIQRIVMSRNRLTGSIPHELGSLQDLNDLELADNLLSGTIPVTLSNCTQMQNLTLANNHLIGVVHFEFSQLLQLGRLDLSGNKLSGTIPTSLGNCTLLRELDLSMNHITGEIPSEVGRLPLLTKLAASGNTLVGAIPEELVHCKHLQVLQLNGNGLTGSVPSSLGSLSDLQSLEISANGLEGSIPSSLGNCKNLHTVNFSRNSFSGSIPEEFENLDKLQAVDLSANSFTGKIPSGFGDCKALFKLDLSLNNLEGEIPESISSLPLLVSFNVSFNRLNGELPRGGVFRNLSGDSFLGNPGLCGPIFERECSEAAKCRGLKCPWFKIFLAVGVPAVTVILACLMWFFSSDRKDGHAWGAGLTEVIISRTKSISGLIHMTPEAVKEIANNFSEENMICLGARSLVYRGVLPGPYGKLVAVKLLDPEHLEITRGLDGSLLDGVYSEMEALAGLRHRNLVRIYGVCLSPEVKGIVLEYMENRSLHHRLHEVEKCNLSLETRLDIAIGIADALLHLHYDCPGRIIHMDLKPSNILLNSELVPKIADFGISKFAKIEGDQVATALALFGTVGYSPPEYDSSNVVSISGDVFSYGVVLLEMCTGRQPTSFTTDSEHLTLRSWVYNAFPDRISSVVDQSLQEEIGTQVEKLRLLLHVGLLCAGHSSQTRPTMRQVREMLDQIKCVKGNHLVQQWPEPTEEKAVRNSKNEEITHA